MKYEIPSQDHRQDYREIWIFNAYPNFSLSKVRQINPHQSVRKFGMETVIHWGLISYALSLNVDISSSVHFE